MNDTSKAIIFLSSERGHTESNWHRSYATFGNTITGGVQKPPFGNLYQLHDDTLAGGKAASVVVEKNTNIVLLPTVGGLMYQHQNSEGEVQAGEIVVLSLAAGQIIELKNPFGNDLLNYLQLWFSTDAVAHTSPALYVFDLNVLGNQFVNIFEGLSSSNAHGLTATISIGKFAGRAEAVYSVGKKRGLFVFVLQGAFEVQYRLLESRDGLALWDVQEVEVEALSNEAILLLIELPVNV